MPAFVLVALLASSCVHETPHGGPPGRSARSPCFEEQVRIEGFCIDKYEAYVVELDDQGREHPHAPYDVIGDKRVRAKVARGVAPQAYISQVQSAHACVSAGKRLCKPAEYIRACRGTNKNDLYPYGGMQRRPGLCNEGKGSFVALAFGQDFFKLTYENFNDPKLDQMPNGLAHTGSFPRCASPDGVFDMVGNLHEWTAAPTGVFRGGYFLDTSSLGEGCSYVTTGHIPSYRDYSIGFRCCADLPR